MADHSRESTSRTKEEIFAGMHRELRSWNPHIPESPDRLDPILRLLLQLYSNQLARIDSRVDEVWDVATNSLIRSLCPESMRWPVPAFTVMRCEPVDPVVEVDPHSKFFYKETREGGQTYFFSALRKEKLIAAKIKYLYLQIDETIVDLSPQSGEEMTTTSRLRTGFTAGMTYRVYLGIDYSGQASDFTDASVFLKGMPDVLRQLRWARWFPGSHMGGFYDDSSFCPGLVSDLSTMLAAGGRMIDWGGLRTSAELFKPLEDSFVVLPEKFTGTWEPGPPAPDLLRKAADSGARMPEESEHLFWARLDLPTGGDKSKLQAPFEVYFNCFIAVNKNELTLFKHTGGNTIVEVEIPEDIFHVLEITGVVDSSGREYVPKHLLGADGNKRFYSPEERNNRLVLWFDFSAATEFPPDSLTIYYSITAGTSANGIEAGKIADLYEHHPGIDTAVNIIPVAGAIPAKTEDQVVIEVANRLRNRDRALSFAEINSWSKTFDPRIRDASSENGVERFARGVRRCIVVRIQVAAKDFYSDDELKLLQSRMAVFLKARSPVNTHYRVEIAKT